MERSPLPPRKQPLRNTTPIPRGDSELARSPMPPRNAPLPRQRLSGTGLSRKARQAPRKPWRPSRPQVSREEVEARRIVMRRAQGCCEGCGRPGQTDWSHRVGRGQCGPWHASNGLALCRPEHDWAGTHPAVAREQYGWILRSTDDFLTYPAWLHGVGWALLLPDGGIEPTTREAA